MYPVIRMGRELRRIRKLPKLGFFDEHSSLIRIYPNDIDMFRELNNGRTLTLYDIPRFTLAWRTGLIKILKEDRMGMTVAGSAVQYRKRITLMQTIRMTAQCVGFDDRFFYLLQNCYRGDEPCGQVVVRMAFTKGGIIPPTTALKNHVDLATMPALPDWIVGIAKAEAMRPWPPKPFGMENQNA